MDMEKAKSELNNPAESGSQNRSAEHEFGMQGVYEKEDAKKVESAEKSKKIEQLKSDLEKVNQEIAEAEAKMEVMKAQISAGEQIAKTKPGVADLHEKLRQAQNQERIALFDHVQKLKGEREGVETAIAFYEKPETETLH